MLKAYGWSLKMDKAFVSRDKNASLSSRKDVAGQLVCRFEFLMKVRFLDVAMEPLPKSASAINL